MILQNIKLINMYRLYSWNSCLLFLMLLNITWCYPTGKPDLETQPELRDEQHYPNGTVVGKYSYTDHEGNPIQVKYYADEGSYGVELKSIKVVDSSADPSLSTLQPMKFDNLLRPTETQFKLPAEVMNANYPVMANKYKTNDPFDYLNKDTTKPSHYKAERGNSDYDVYYKNELNGPKKCSNEKFRVYLDKEKRRIRNAIDSFDAAKFCEQF